MIEESVLQRTLQTALAPRRRLRRGVRRRPPQRLGAASTTAKVEEFVSGPRARRRHPGRAGRDHRLRAHRRPDRGRACRPRPKRPPPRPGAPRAPRTWPRSSAGRCRPPHEVRRAAGVGGEGPQGRGAGAGRRTPPASVGDSIRQVSATYADSRRRILVANSDGLLVEDDQVRTRFGVNCVAVGDTGMQTGTEAPGRTLGFELFDEIDPEEVARTAAERALTMLDARVPRRAARLPVVLQARRRRGAVPRGVRPRARGRPRRQGRVGVPGPGRRAGRVAARHAGRRRHVRARVGHATRSTTRARPRSATCSSRTACSPTTCGTSCAPARTVARAAATAGARRTSTCRWCA